MNNDIILYDHDGSPCSRRVKIALIEKGVPFKVQPIDLSKMQQKHTDYLAVNPNGLVPALAIDGKVLFESSVINDYLEDRFSSLSLAAPTTEGQITSQMWQTLELAMAKLYRPLMYSRVMGPLHHIACSKDEFLRIAAKATDNSAHLAWDEKIWSLKVLTPQEQDAHVRKIYRFADLVERSLENKRYLVDEKFSFADITVFPRMNMFPMVGIDLHRDNYPNITHWMEELKQRKSFRETQSSLEQSMEKLLKFGVIRNVNRIVYQTKPLGLKDKLTLAALRPVFRKAFNIDDALKNTDPLPPIAKPNNQLTEPKAQGNSLAAKSRKTAPKSLASDKNLTLYGDIHSPICQRVEWVLNAANITYHFENINMAKNQHQEDTYSALNPAQELPLLIHGNTRIFDSLFIAEYIDSLSPKVNLFSKDATELLQIRLWNAFDMGMHKEFGVLFHHQLGNKNATEADRTHAIEVLQEKLIYLENQLINKDFLVANRLTYADYIMFSRLRGIRFVAGIQVFNNIDNIKRWEKSINKAVNESIGHKQQKSDQQNSVAAIS